MIACQTSKFEGRNANYFNFKYSVLCKPDESEPFKEN